MAKNAAHPTIYDTMDFPPYKFSEYPKMVEIGGKRLRVNSPSEERTLRPAPAKASPAPAAGDK